MPADGRQSGEPAPAPTIPGMAPQIVVLGLGNPVLADDAVGLKVAEAFQRLLDARPLPGVIVLASTRAGFELIDMLQGFRHALIVDALELPEPRAGHVQLLDMAHVAGSVRLNMMHEISITAAFELAARLGIPMPAQVEIYAVEAADTRTLSEELTAEVAAAVEPLAEQLYARAAELAALYGCTADDTPEGDAPPSRVFYPPQ